MLLLLLLLLFLLLLSHLLLLRHPPRPAPPQNDGTSAKSSRDTINQAFQNRKLMAKEVTLAVEMFNEKPKKGIAHLVDKGLVQQTPEAVAAFLRAHNETLSKTQIGEYIGGEDEWSLAVMHAFVDQMQFSGMDLDISLRAFLSGFRLPGEAQKIDRILEKFASRYCEQNPTTFESADTAFILSFAIIMLNTDLHNPGIKPERKMTLESFLKTCKRATTELSDETLGNIFQRIKTDEITLKEDDALRSTQSSGTVNVFNRKKSVGSLCLLAYMVILFILACMAVRV